MVNSLKELDGHDLTRVFAMTQDDKGFLWLASRYGLLRYDGQRIKAFTSKPNGNNSLPNDYVADLAKDRDGYIWLATLGGLVRFDPRTEEFLTIKLKAPNVEDINSNKIYRMHLGNGTNLWLATYAGVYRIDSKTMAFEHVQSQMFDQPSDQTTRALAVIEDKQGKIWYVLHRKGIYRYDPASGNNEQFDTKQVKNGEFDRKTVTILYRANDDTIWFGSRRYIFRLNDTNHHLSAYPIPIKAVNEGIFANVRKIFQDKDKNIWVTTLYNGISLLANNSEQLVNLNQNDAGQQTLDEAHNFAAFQDNMGLLWFSGPNNGLTRLNLAHSKLHHIRAAKDHKPHITSLIKNDDNSYFFGSNKSLYIKRPGQAAQLLLENIGTIVSMIRHLDGRLLLDIPNQGIFFYELDGNKMYEHPASNEKLPGLPQGNLQSLGIDKYGNLWLGQYNNARLTRSGVFKYDLANDSYSHVINDFTVDAILPVDDKVLMGSRAKGLHLHDTIDGSWQRITTEGYDTDWIHHIYQDAQQRIWFSTANSGLAQLTLDPISVRFITQSDGLPSNNVTAIVQDRANNFWLGTTEGIVHFNPTTEQIRIFNHKQGIRIRNVFPESAIILDNGDIVMASSKEIVQFNPEQLLQNSDVSDSQVLLSDFRLLNLPVKLRSEDPHSVLTQPVDYLNSLTLSYQDYLFSLNFSNTDFRYSDSSQFAYRMKGFRDDWIETHSPNHIATFTSLPAGDYQLQIKTTRSDGSWSDDHRTLDITVTPPWYLSTQAYVIYIILTVAAIALFIKMREARLVQQAKRLEQTVQERTEQLHQRSEQLQQSRDQITELLGHKERTFANISHEFKTPLTLILSPLESVLTGSKLKAIPEDVRNKLQMMKRNGSRLLRMVEQMLELSRLDTAVNQKHRNYSLKDTLNVLVTSFQPLVESKSLTLNSNSFEDVVLTLRLDSLEMILTNLISNAIKYTPEHGKIDIQVATDDSNAIIKISDSGMGISEQNQALVFNRFTRASEEHDEKIPGAGIGLALVKELIESHHGTISLASKLGEGSCFTVSLPINKDPEAKVDAMEAISATSKTEIDALMFSTQVETEAEIEIDAGSGKQTVLLIDDNADMLQLLTDTLAHKYSCITAPNGEQGLAKAKEMIPDLIISDVMMPGISGYEVAKGLKDEELTCHIPVILLTAKGDIDSRMEGWKQDIDDYLAKPFHPKELLLRIESLLSIRAILKQRFITAQNKNHGNSDNIGVTEPGISEKDSKFILRLKEVINSHYQDHEFSRDNCANILGISERQLSRKMSALMNESFPDLLRDHRLSQACSLMQTGMQISQICDEVGFSALSYFGKCFKAKYGKTPKQYQKDVII